MSSALDALDGFELLRIDSFESLEGPEESVARVLAPLRVAHALATPMLWCIASGGVAVSDGISWIAGLGEIAGTHDGREELGELRLPSGVTSCAVSRDAAQRLLAACEEWVGLEAVVMPKVESVESDELRDAILAQIAHRVFACVIRAEPASDDQIDSDLLSLDQVARTGQLQGRAEFASSRTSSDLAIERFADLTAARQLGGWTVQLDVGASKGQAVVVAELMAAALDIPGLSFQVEGQSSSVVSEAWRQPKRRFVASTPQMARILRPPSRELPGVALRATMPFDLNAESDLIAGRDERELDLGVALDSALRPSGRFKLSASTLNRHALVCGATGSGKSQTVQHMLEELSSIGVPWLVIEPAKAEYRSMRKRLMARSLDCPVHVIRLGDPDSAPLGLNPLEPEPGFPLQTHVDMVSALFVASFDAVEPFPQILAEALRRCYHDLGWALATGEYKRNTLGTPTWRGQTYPRYPTLADLQRTARDVVYDVGYGREVRDNVLGFVDVRLGSLRNGTPGRFFDGGHPLDLAALHRGNVVIEIEDVGNDLDKAFVIGTVILRLYEHLRAKGPSMDQRLTHVTVVEEAHRLLRRAEPGAKQSQAVELFGAMLSEVRAFGEGIVIAEQIPTKILPDVLKNTAVQIVHRLPSVEDRAILAGTTNMNDDQSAYVLAVRPGCAAAFREGMDRPVLLLVDYPGVLADREAPPVGLGELRRRVRSISCDGACHEAPCTARMLDAGPQLARSTPELPFWIELIFLAFVSESEIPRAGRVWSSAVARLLKTVSNANCTLAGLVEAAVTARWAEAADFYDPTRLADAMFSATLRTLIDGGAASSTGGFAAGRFLVRDVYDQLVATGEDSKPHGLTATWREELGIDLLEAPAPVQRAWLELGPLFSYPGHARLLSGLTPSSDSGPRSRIEQLAKPLASGLVGAAGVAAACQRVTPDHKVWVKRLSDWLGLAVES